MEYEKIILSSKDIHCSEITEDPTSLNAKFAICTFEVNGNGMKLNRATIGDWLYTLVSQPVVGKIGISDSGEADFTSHNMHPVTRINEAGTTYTDFEFDTSACGVFTNAQIEIIDGKECITAEAKIWKRFPEFCAIVKKRLMNGTLNTSWEIETEKSHMELSNGKKIKVIDKGRFLGHALLASYITPAYPESQLLDVASMDTENELLDALNKDISEISNTTQKEEINVPDLKDPIVAEPVVAGATITAPETAPTDVAMLTEFDLRKALREAISDKLGKEKWDFYIVYHFPANGVVWIQMWDTASELDVITFSYTVENDVVTMSDPVNAKLAVSVAEINKTVADLNTKIEEQTEALVTSNASIQTLNTTVSTLTPYKEKFEQEEQKKIESELATQRDELKGYAIASGLIDDTEFSEGSELQSFVDQLDKGQINAIIAERFMEKQAKTPEVQPQTVETAAAVVAPKANLESLGDVPDHVAFIHAFIG